MEYGVGSVSSHHRPLQLHQVLRMPHKWHRKQTQHHAQLCQHGKHKLQTHTSMPNIAPATKSGIPLIREVHQISELWCLQRRHLMTMYCTRHDICTLSPVDTTVAIKLEKNTQHHKNRQEQVTRYKDLSRLIALLTQANFNV